MKEIPPVAAQAEAVHAAFLRAVAHHQQGRLDEAERLYREVLAVAPEHFDALHLHGVLLHQRGLHEAAREAIGRAIRINPSEAAAHSNLGLVHQALGRLAEAVTSYDAALALRPDFAEACFNQGNAWIGLRQAERALGSYERALAIRPAYAEALNARGLALLGLGRNEEALRGLERALALRPAYPEAWLNRGVAASRLRRHADALEAFDRALALRPDYVDALANRGGALASLGRHEEALASYARALELRPGFVEALVNRGALLNQLERPAEALESLDAALAADPEHVGALVNRGAALVGLGRSEEAMTSLERALEIVPDHAEALNNRGNILRERGRFEEALASYERILAVDSGNAEALVNRGAALRELRRPQEALDSHRRALELDPDNAGALVGIGNAYAQLKQMEEALAHYDRALAAQPGLGYALLNRGAALRDLKRPGEAADAYHRLLASDPGYPYAQGYAFHSRMHACDWSDYEASVGLLEAGVLEGRRVDAPFSFLSVSGSAAAQLRCAQAWVADKCPAAREPVWRGERYGHERIRVAYLSADYGDHPVATCVAELFELHDRAQFEVIGVSFGPENESAMRARLRAGVDRFVDVRDRSDLDTARLLREMEIDIAVDLNGYTQGNRAVVFAQRAAPVQVNYLGYSGTMGAPYIDYIIGDARVIPPGQEAYYSEKVVRLPDSYLVNDRRRAVAGPAPARAEAGLPERGFVFCCFNNSYKITPVVFEAWMRLLRQVEGSVLWLFEDNPTAPQSLRREAARRGVAPGRLVFARRTPRLEDHLARYRVADLFLDTLPYNAHVTSIDALWTGLPVLTCMGTTFAGRVAGSLLHALGLPELVTQAPGDYEALALELARDPQRLAGLRARLAANCRTHALFDTGRYTRHIEQAYRLMLQRSRQGLPAQAIVVEPLP